MFDFFPQILIIAAIAGIVVIIIRKYPQASKLKDSEKEKSSESKTFWGRILTVLKYVGNKIKDFSILVFKNIYPKARNVKRGRELIQPEDDIVKLSENKPLIQKEENKEVATNAQLIEDQSKIVDLLEAAAELLGSDNYHDAEKKYIEIIKLDPQNIRAYKGLGKVYKEQKNIKDAKSSYEQVLVIKPGDSEAKEELKKIQLGE